MMIMWIHINEDKVKLKPFAQILKDVLDNGDVYYKQTAEKHTYTYKLRKT